MRLKLTNELLTEIREITFGDCTVVYEAMSNEELEADLLQYLTEGRIIKDRKTGELASYTASLTLTTLKQWLMLRVKIEGYDVNPETPFDRSDEEIKKAIKREKEIKARLTSNVNRLMAKLRSTQS